MNEADKLLRDACLTRVQWAALMAWAANQGPGVYERLDGIRRAAMVAG